MFKQVEKWSQFTDAYISVYSRGEYLFFVFCKES